MSKSSLVTSGSLCVDRGLCFNPKSYDVFLINDQECEYLLGVGEPGRLLGPVSAAWGLKEFVLTVGMALLTRRPQVAMLMFICGARRKVLPRDTEGKYV